MAVFQSIEGLVGNTPCVKMLKAAMALGADREIYGKLECMNPTGSAKDRAAYYMLKDAEEKGLLTKGSTVVEPTSGNTGIALAALGAKKGYKVILTMPDTMSRERISLLKAYGAEVVLTSGKDGMAGAIACAEKYVKEQGAFMPGQFSNEANARAHEETTAKELISDFPNGIGAFVAGVGTGGTLTGTARGIRKHYPDAKILAVEPASSPLLSKGEAGAHGLQGIGANFVPDILDTKLIDEIITVGDEEAFYASKIIAREEGLLLGITSGAAFFAASKIAGSIDKNLPVIALLPDSGTRYLSTGIYE
ncbi:MAG: cysteine synthase A [Clostridia bacterium]|nr:cysteine synthase A [Clostridia bacterium]